LALLVFDAAVNNGPDRAARWLQAAVDSEIDGQIGPATLRTVQTSAAKQAGAAVCAEFMTQRLVFMASLPIWRSFGLGWARRLCALPYQAVTMASGNLAASA
jgi:lysozyme family protein